MMKILIADDERTIAVTLRDSLEKVGHTVQVVGDGLSALEKVSHDDFNCLILDVKLPRLSGMEVLKKVKETGCETQVIIVTAYGSVESAVEAMKMGAFDYLQKPFLNEEMLIRLERMESFLKLKAQYLHYQKAVEERFGFGAIIGKSKTMQKVYQLIETVAQSNASVLIQGESGTGKELVAQAIHYNSLRKDQEFVKISCTMIPDTLIENELFGHDRGAFTDAKERKIGKFERAHKGTLFIDDVDDMPVNTQAKFLTVLQDQKFERIGGNTPIQADTRIIVATKVDLEQAIGQGRFREDLYHRINVVTIHLPSLRDREGDIPLLVERFIRLYGKGEKYYVTPETLYALEQYAWPGNVRELEKAVERAITLAGRERTLRREHLLKESQTYEEMRIKITDKKLKSVLETAEIQHIRQVLKEYKGNKNEVAALLNISRKSLWEKIKHHKIPDEGMEPPKSR